MATNKYAEGYPGRRYYGGCEHIDTVERLAIERIKSLFGAAYANVQPHSGASANTAVYFALLKHGDTILGLDLAHGGHLTHGMRLNYSGKTFHVVPYHVGDDGQVDMDEVGRLAHEHKPAMIIAGWSAYPRQLDFAAFRAVGVAPDWTLTLGSTEAVKQAAAAGLGLAVVSALAAADLVALGKLHRVVVDGLEIRRSLTRLRLRDRVVQRLDARDRLADRMFGGRGLFHRGGLGGQACSFNG